MGIGPTTTCLGLYGLGISTGKPLYLPAGSSIYIVSYGKPLLARVCVVKCVVVESTQSTLIGLHSLSPVHKNLVAESAAAVGSITNAGAPRCC